MLKKKNGQKCMVIVLKEESVQFKNNMSGQLSAKISQLLFIEIRKLPTLQGTLCKYFEEYL